MNKFLCVLLAIIANLLLLPLHILIMVTFAAIELGWAIYDFITGTTENIRDYCVNCYGKQKKDICEIINDNENY